MGDGAALGKINEFSFHHAFSASPGTSRVSFPKAISILTLYSVKSNGTSPAAGLEPNILLEKPVARVSGNKKWVSEIPPADSRCDLMATGLFRVCRRTCCEDH